MQDRIVNILVSVLMVVISLYPMYNHLKSTVTDINNVIIEANQSITAVNDELIKFQNDLNDLSNQVDLVKHELEVTINDGLADTKDMINDGLSDTRNVINKEIKSLNEQISKIKSGAVEDVKLKKEEIKKKTRELIPGLGF